MNILHELRRRVVAALTGIASEPENFANLVLPAQNPQFGDYQANCAMPLAKQLGKKPRDVATEIVEKLDVADLCETPDIAGPGFINLKLKSDVLASQLEAALNDDRVGVAAVENPENVVLDFSSPNVAKPMHVGHLRSTVIGDALYRILSFLGHKVTSDNHVGDWGTQFGMILYGYKHLLDKDAYAKEPVSELSRLYRLVNQLSEYHQLVEQLPGLEWKLAETEQAVNDAEAETEQNDKESKRVLKKLKQEMNQLREAVRSAENKISAVNDDPDLKAIALAHPDVHELARKEIAKLHNGNLENRKLWEEFLPACFEAMEEVYQRLNISFDHTLGESYYQPMLADVVDDLKENGLAHESQGAMCVFIPGNRAPFIVQKQDGAYTYATTDLATIQYRATEWDAKKILYVVDKRQSEHFQLLFETAKLWGYNKVDFRHISFGTVMGKDNKPYKTRSGDIIGLGSLLDEAVSRARVVVDSNDDSKPNGPELSEEERQQIAEIVGIGSIKYADLHHNRDSDYVFDWDKMISMTGDTAAYMQYAFARVCGIFRKAGVTREQMRTDDECPLQLTHSAERALGIQLARFEEALTNVTVEYRPNLLTGYLFDVANAFSSFYDKCPVSAEPSDAIRISRFKLCDLTASTIQRGLELLGIETSPRM
ncbi:arginine--tRNA ligase [Rubinisphaera sp. JC750]|uniref:arginine--tRNA ligase n=1 Tax=Rubinisphaera sp. JC750 TaxID=2898658 RepID=UPI001F018183|nr:arginine--tRNA ligase [Rubinisphaera sp. JC750]